MKAPAKPLAAVAGSALIGFGLTAYGALKFWKRMRSRTYNFSGKTVVVTGGSRGLGLALARGFAAAGANVAILGRDAVSLDRAEVILSRNSSRILAQPCDVTERDQVETSLETVRSRFGPIDVLVNNAGLIAVGPFDSMTTTDFRDSLNLHFWGPLYTTLAVLPDMRRRKQGRIVNISSVGGKISVPHLMPYSVGKFALAGFSEGLQAEVARDNIFVTSVYPGLMRTGSPRNAMFKGKHRGEYAWFSVSDSLPGISVDADSAARQILSACKRGDSNLILSLPAKIAIHLHQLFPRKSASILSTVSRVLPGPGGIGSTGRKGFESKSWISPSWLTILDELGARKNNEIAV